MNTFFYFLKYMIILSVTVIIGSGCTGLGRLQEGEQLYGGANIHITKSEISGATKILKPDLKKAVILPRPNKKFLWIRPQLAIYNTFQNNREKSFGNFIANQFGEPPVLFEAKVANRHIDLLRERAGNDGYFYTKISSTEKKSAHSTKLYYEIVVVSPREIVDSLVYASDSTALTNSILAMRSKSLVKVGMPYHLEELVAERERLTDTLRNHGWYYFSADNLVFEADTLHPPGDIHLTLRVKKQVGERERQRYRLATITVIPDYDLIKQGVENQEIKDTLHFGCITYIYADMPTKPEVLNEQILLRCGDYYSNNDYQSTIFRLLNLNLYKFINIRFEVSPLSDSLLDARIFLTPYRPERVDATLSGIFSPGFYFGLQTGVAYNHRNVFRRANALRLSLDGAYLRTNKNNFDFVSFLVSDVSARLTLPLFLFLPQKKSLAFSTTQFSLRHESNLFNYDLPELGHFSLSFQRIQAEGGYLWKKSRRGSFVQEANPLSLGLHFSTINKQAIRQQLIAGIPTDTTGTSLALLTFVEFKPNYTITFDQRLEPARQHTVYFRLRATGQASGYMTSKYLPADYQLTSPLNFFLETDFRQYQKTIGRNVLAMRIAAGAGIPLRKQGIIPLLDRFVIGGASSVRAFAPRTVGPGSQPRDTVSSGLKVGNNTGNVLIEGSLEYRIPIGRYPELAFFLDAGNVWLTSGPEATEASQFRFNRFFREFAIGAGAGLRINLGFFVLRMDLAFPLAKPYLPVGQRWVGNDLHFGSGSWRRDNLNWNFSFGYPF